MCDEALALVPYALTAIGALCSAVVWLWRANGKLVEVYAEELRAATVHARERAERLESIVLQVIGTRGTP